MSRLWDKGCVTNAEGWDMLTVNDDRVESVEDGRANTAAAEVLRSLADVLEQGESDAWWLLDRDVSAVRELVTETVRWQEIGTVDDIEAARAVWQRAGAVFAETVSDVLWDALND